MSDSDIDQDFSLPKQTDAISNSEAEETDRVLQPVLPHALVSAAPATERRQMTWKQKVKHEIIMTHMGSASSLSDCRSLIHLLN
jgi:hypothetical protein